MQWFAIVTDISASGTLVIPVELAVVEVLDFGFACHPVGYRAEDALHHREMLAIVVCLE